MRTHKAITTTNGSDFPLCEQRVGANDRRAAYAKSTKEAPVAMTNDAKIDDRPATDTHSSNSKESNMPDVFKKISFRNEKNSEGKEVIIMELREGGALDLAVARIELTEGRAYDVIDALTWRLSLLTMF
jgi:hypothetical protein